MLGQYIYTIIMPIIQTKQNWKKKFQLFFFSKKDRAADELQEPSVRDDLTDRTYLHFLALKKPIDVFELHIIICQQPDCEALK